MNHLNNHLRKKHGLKQPLDLTVEDLCWYVLGAVAVLFWFVFVCRELHNKFNKPQPASQMSKTMESRK